MGYSCGVATIFVCFLNMGRIYPKVLVAVNVIVYIIPFSFCFPFFFCSCICLSFSGCQCCSCSAFAFLFPCAFWFLFSHHHLSCFTFNFYHDVCLFLVYILLIVPAVLFFMFFHGSVTWFIIQSFVCVCILLTQSSDCFLLCLHFLGLGRFIFLHFEHCSVWLAFIAIVLKVILSFKLTPLPRWKHHHHYYRTGSQPHPLRLLPELWHHLWMVGDPGQQMLSSRRQLQQWFIHSIRKETLSREQQLAGLCIQYLILIPLHQCFHVHICFFKLDQAPKTFALSLSSPWPDGPSRGEFCSMPSLSNKTQTSSRWLAESFEFGVPKVQHWPKIWRTLAATKNTVRQYL